ncbi:MAG: phosphoribosylanthranilate isomerase [Alphaproteobacteria bacterium]
MTFDTATLEIKICGLSTAETVRAARAAGADFLGFVLYPKSPRAVTPEQASALIEAGRAAEGTGQSVALVVDATDAELKTLTAKMAPDWIQLHGSETPERVTAVKALTGRPVIKALAVADRDDLAGAKAFSEVADRLLLDARPTAPAGDGGHALPGGNGLCFDWSILDGWSAPVPWLLAGGLNPKTVADAIARTGAPGVDVSSGVEASRGIKSVPRIKAFVAASRGGAPGPPGPGRAAPTA